ncbi:MAG: histidine phosphatase family protein [Candidatus Kariarchaeaceae archaeon]
MKLFIVRHGQTDSNLEARIMGHLDVPLNKIGCRQALYLAEYLSSFTFDVIYSSPSARTKETAEVIHGFFEAETDEITPLSFDASLMERGMGRFEGMLLSDLLEEITTEEAEVWDDIDWAPEGGESRIEVESRVISFINMLRQKHGNDNVLVVTHGGPIKFILGQLLQISHSKALDISQNNCSVNEIHFSKDEFKIIRIDDRKYLSELVDRSTH